MTVATCFGNQISLVSMYIIYYFIMGLLSKSVIHIIKTGLVFLSHASLSISSRLKFCVSFLTGTVLSEIHQFERFFKTK